MADSAAAFEMTLDLVVGPSGEFTEDQLRRGWRVHGRELTEHLRGHDRPGLRPWGFWRFEAERPGLDKNYVDGVVYLAETGDLSERERMVIAERGQQARERLASGETFYHGAEEGLRLSVELAERVKQALEEADGG